MNKTTEETCDQEEVRTPINKALDKITDRIACADPEALDFINVVNEKGRSRIMFLGEEIWDSLNDEPMKASNGTVEGYETYLGRRLMARCEFVAKKTARVFNYLAERSKFRCDANGVPYMKGPVE